MWTKRDAADAARSIPPAYRRTLAAIAAEEAALAGVSPAALRDRFDAQRGRAAAGTPLAALLPPCFALVREAAHRLLGLRLRDAQLVAGIVLQEGKIAELATGEGKTLAAAAPLALRVLAGDGAHLVTANEYLSAVGGEALGPIFAALGLTVGLVGATRSARYAPQGVAEPASWRPVARADAYRADVVYGTVAAFGFDALRDGLALTAGERVQRGHAYALIDEVDSVLLDEAATPLQLTLPGHAAPAEVALAERVARLLVAGRDFVVAARERRATLTGPGLALVERALGLPPGRTLHADDRVALLAALHQALAARALYRRDRDYVVAEGEVVIVDPGTGRPLPGRRWGEGLHQALEAKEGVAIRPDDRVVAEVTVRGYFRRYAALAGMTGTTGRDRAELRDACGLATVAVPPHRPARRVDLPDLVFRDGAARDAAVVMVAAAAHRIGRPVLVGADSVAAAERLAAACAAAGLPHQVLSARNHAAEAAVVARAGRAGALTIATPLAGRGTDIALDDAARACGGLLVLGTARHDSGRVDDQLRGRAGRRGDPGESRFLIALDDELPRRFGDPDRIARLRALPGERGGPLPARAVGDLFERAQSRVEGERREARGWLERYDAVLAPQRAAYERDRERLLGGADALATARAMIDESLAATPWAERRALLGSIIPGYGGDDGADQTGGAAVDAAIARRATALGSRRLAAIARLVVLTALDRHWQVHLTALQALRAGIGLRAYGGEEPLAVYRRESAACWQTFRAACCGEVATRLLHVDLAPEVDGGALAMPVDRPRDSE